MADRPLKITFADMRGGLSGAAMRYPAIPFTGSYYRKVPGRVRERRENILAQRPEALNESAFGSDRAQHWTGARPQGPCKRARLGFSNQRRSTFPPLVFDQTNLQPRPSPRAGFFRVSCGYPYL
jgi:hypothetical protein